MKKIFYFVSLITISLALFSCKSSKEAGKGEIVEEQIIEAEKNVATKNKDPKKNVEEDDVNNKDKEKGYLGWIDTAIRNPVYEDGIVQIKTDSSLGTFGLFAVEEDGKSIPVLSTLNEYSSTGFYLKAGKRKYKLQASKHVKVGAQNLKNGIVMHYDINNVAHVAVNMNLIKTVKEEPADTIKFVVEIKNTGKKAESYSLKAIFDTVLGERALYHFYDSKENPIKKEYSTRNMGNDRWFVSKNNQASMEFLLDGGDVTPPDLVALANYSTLEKAEWEPNMLTQRAFDTVLSYNNSAVGIIWPEIRLEPETSGRIIFYVSLALYGKNPNGHYFVYGIKPPAKPVEKKPEVIPNLVKDDIKEETPIIEHFVEEQKQEVVEEMPNVEFNINKIQKDHLTLEYVKKLTDRINELDQADNPNRNEILQLSAELDAILSILRQ